MKAAMVEQPGHVPVYGEFADPVARAGEVVVQVTASALSQLVRGRAAGRHYSTTGELPLVAGVDGTGRLDDGRRVYFCYPARRSARWRSARSSPTVDGYLWGTSARSILVAGAKAPPDGVPIRFIQIGAAGGAEIALPAAVLRSSAIEMKGSGLGSGGLSRLIAAIGGVFQAAAKADLTLDHRAVPLAQVAATWTSRGQRIVYLPK